MSTFTTLSTVPWTPDIVNVVIDDQTGLAVSADLVADYPVTFVNIPNKFAFAARVTDPVTSAVYVNLGSPSLPDFHISKVANGDDQFVKTVEITAAQLATLASVPIELLSAISQSYMVDEILWTMTPGMTQYDFNGTATIFQNGAGIENVTTSYLSDSHFINASGDPFSVMMIPRGHTNNQVQYLHPNVPIVFQGVNGSSDPSQGDGTLTARVVYRVF